MLRSEGTRWAQRDCLCRLAEQCDSAVASVMPSLPRGLSSAVVAMIADRD